MDPNNQNKPNPSQRPTWQDSLQEINNILTPVKEVVIILRPNPDLDAVLSGLALSQALKKIGRGCQVISPTKIDPQTLVENAKVDTDTSSFEDLDQVLDFMPQNQLNLIIHYDKGSYSGGDIQKSSKGLELTLMPETGKTPIDPLKIDTRIYNSQPEVVFYLEVENPAILGQFYLSNQTLLKKLPAINIDYHNNNANYGKSNIIDPKASSIAELITLILYDLRFVFDESIANKLYTGLMYRTKNFSQDFYTVNMLEALSICYRYLPQKK